MKKIGYILIAMLLLAGCFKDDSNTNIQELNPIVIEWAGGTQLSVNQMDTLRVEPLIFCEGVPDADLSYEWMFMNFGQIVPKYLDSTMYFCAQITDAPGTYTLRLTVTDETTGIFRIQTFSVQVLSNFSEGLLIADTKDNGLTSDVNLVMSREFNSYYDKDNEERDIYRDVWAGVNGAPLDGELLTANVGNGYGNNQSVTLITTKDVYRADYRDYVLEKTGDDCFFVPPHFSGQDINSAILTYRSNGTWEALAINGLFYERNLQNDGRHYGVAVYPVGVSDYYISMMIYPVNGYTMYPTYAYDDLGKCMLFFNGSTGYKPVEQLSGPFNVNDLSGYNALYLGQTMEGPFLLVDDVATGARQVLMMNYVDFTAVANASNFAKAIYDASAAPNIGQARYYAASRIGNAVYYANENQVYAGPVDNMANSSLQWTADPGETITGITVYDWTGGQHYYEGTDGNDATQSSEGHLLLIATQKSDGEGKLTCVPIVHQHVGQLEQNKKYHVVLEGFGKILGVYKQIN